MFISDWPERTVVETAARFSVVEMTDALVDEMADGLVDDAFSAIVTVDRFANIAWEGDEPNAKKLTNIH